MRKLQTKESPSSITPEFSIKERNPQTVVLEISNNATLFPNPWWNRRRRRIHQTFYANSLYKYVLIGLRERVTERSINLAARSRAQGKVRKETRGLDSSGPAGLGTTYGKEGRVGRWVMGSIREWKGGRGGGVDGCLFCLWC